MTDNKIFATDGYQPKGYQPTPQPQTVPTGEPLAGHQPTVNSLPSTPIPPGDE
jgi:hypothetical protein